MTLRHPRGLLRHAGSGDGSFARYAGDAGLKTQYCCFSPQATLEVLQNPPSRCRSRWFFAHYAPNATVLGLKTGAPSVGGVVPSSFPAAPCRGSRWEFRPLRGRCRSEDRRSWPSPRFFAGGDGSFARYAGEAGLKTGAPGPSPPTSTRCPAERPGRAVCARWRGGSPRCGRQRQRVRGVPPDSRRSPGS